MGQSLPVLMYHYINRRPGPICVSPERFDAHCAALARSGRRGVGLEQAEAFLLHGEPLSKGAVLITFDDGFLDNYVHALPSLEAHGHQGVVFAVAGRLEAEGVRPTMADVREGRAAEADIPDIDAPRVVNDLGLEEQHDRFLSWDEARVMDGGGVLRVAPHSMDHASVFSGPAFKGIHRPRHRGRAFDRVRGEQPFGLPRFELGPALATRAFLPSEELLDLCRERVPQDPADAKAYFENPERLAAWKACLEEFEPERLGHMETRDQYRERVGAEFVECAEVFRRELGREPVSFCWPWGAWNEDAREMARAAGYRCFFTTRPGPNTAGAAPAVHRFKVRDKSPAWLGSRVAVYARPWLAWWYGLLRG